MLSNSKLDQFWIPLVSGWSTTRDFCCSNLDSRAPKTESSHSWDYIHQDCPFRRSLKAKVVKVRNSPLVELFQSQSKTIGRYSPLEF